MFVAYCAFSVEQHSCQIHNELMPHLFVAHIQFCTLLYTNSQCPRHALDASIVFGSSCWDVLSSGLLHKRRASHPGTEDFQTLYSLNLHIVFHCSVFGRCTKCSLNYYLCPVQLRYRSLREHIDISSVFPPATWVPRPAYGKGIKVLERGQSFKVDQLQTYGSHA